MSTSAKDTLNEHDYNKIDDDDHDDHDHSHGHIKLHPKQERKSTLELDRLVVPKNDNTLNKLWIVTIICLIFMIIEIIGGYLANSIAIMSDAAHLLSDLFGILASIISIYISRRRANHEMSFGFHRAEVIGALVSVCLIWGLTLWLLYEATLRVVDNKPVDGFIMLIVAVIGFFFNVVMGLVLAYQGIDHHLHKHHHGEEEELHGHSHGASEKEVHSHGDKEDGHNHKEEKSHSHNHGHKTKDRHNHPHPHPQPPILKFSHDKPKVENKPQTSSHGHSHGASSADNVNLRAALIHVVGDAIQNLGVVLAGLLIYFKPEWSIADPICTFVFSIIVVYTTIRILRECIFVLMEGSPVEIDIKILENELANIKYVVQVHDLHVWSLSVGKLSLSCHLISTNPQKTLKSARKYLKEKYKITHSTIQVELDSDKIKDDCEHDLHHVVKRNSSH